MAIYISPSTQEHNFGIGNYGTEEQMMNRIADVVCECLTASGVPWYRNQPTMTLQKVVIDSNSKKPDIHFAIHSNAGGGEGSEILVFSESSKGALFAKYIQTFIEPLTPSVDRGIKVRPDLYELRNTTAPACLIEVAFHDDTEDAEFILNNIQNIGMALAHGICEYYKVEFISPYEVNYKTLYEKEVKKNNEFLAHIDEIAKICDIIKKTV